MNIYPGANPAFLTRNYLNRHANNAGDLLVSSGSATRHRLFDMDRKARWQSQGSSDAVTETINFGLWIPGARASHDVEYILIQNHNIKGLTVEVSNNNGSTWTTVFASTTLAEKNTRIIMVSTPADRVRITMTTTQTADQEKAIGFIVVAGTSFQAGPFFEYKPDPYHVQQKTAKMSDGSLRGQLIGRSDASFHFWSAKCAFVADPSDHDTEQEFNDFMDTFEEFGLQGLQFVFLPEPGDRPEQVFLCRVRPGTYNDPYIKSSQAHGGMRAVQMVIEEIGGA